MNETLLLAMVLTIPADVDIDPFARAGHPERTSRLARPGRSWRGIGYFVGGGCARWKRSEPKTRAEGTWGWDYRGKRVRFGKIALGWRHGRRKQGGPGSYRTDGGPHVPDIPNALRRVQKDKQSH